MTEVFYQCLVSWFDTREVRWKYHTEEFEKLDSALSFTNKFSSIVEPLKNVYQLNYKIFKITREKIKEEEII